MTQIEQTLRKETKELKAQFIAKNIEWAKNSFEEYKKSPFIHSLVRKDGSVSYYKKQFGSTRSEDSKINQLVGCLNKGINSFVEKSIKDAEMHYETSLKKLVFRVSSKLAPGYLRVESASVGVNINIILSDGTKTVRAWTIVAEGEIQRPHYRYLVK
jgi:hypothetical protein